MTIKEIQSYFGRYGFHHFGIYDLKDYLNRGGHLSYKKKDICSGCGCNQDRVTTILIFYYKWCPITKPLCNKCCSKIASYLALELL